MASKPVCPMARVGMVSGVQHYGGLLYCLVPQGQDVLSGFLFCGIWHVVCARPKWGLHALMGCDEMRFVMRWEPGQLQTEGGPIYQDGAAM